METEQATPVPLPVVVASSGSTDSSYSSEARYTRRARRRRSYRSDDDSLASPRNTVVDLVKIRRRRDAKPDLQSVEPAIMWNTKVFYPRRGREFGDEEDMDAYMPDLRYIDDRPIEFSLGVGSTQVPADTKQTASEPAEWKGPVITIEVLVEVRRARFRSSGILDAPRPEMLNPKRVSKRYLVVHSPMLAEAINDMVDYYPSLNYSWPGQTTGNTLRIPEPFAVLLHHFDSIETMADRTSAGTICKSEHHGNAQRIDQLKKHAQHLLDFIRPIYQEHILTCQRHLSDSVPRVAFDMIWYLLKPGIDVYIHVDGSTHAAVVLDVKPSGISQLDSLGVGIEKGWLVDLWRLETDGNRLQRALISVKVHAYSGLREVTTLPVCPISIWDAWDGGKRREQILRRSTIFFKALRQGNLLAEYNGPIKHASQYYSGKLVIDHRRGLADSDHEEPMSSLREIDDSNRFQEYDDILVNNDWSFHTTEEIRPRPPRRVNEPYLRRPGPSTWTEGPAYRANKTLNAEPSGPVVGELTEHQLLLLCPDVLAYALRHKEWILISLDYVQESVPSNESLDNLVIGHDELKTIQALSNRQNSKTRQWSADFIEGKGSGQIILLHGPPGVGKTYTVEAISEWLHRPLLALTVADIGTSETIVERELVKWFNLAEAWNAVLLVDEADIFLERRQNRDLARNGLVSAFLRRMEYFKGLLFLTTNRVGQIDDAFISRVHIAIDYQPLDEETRRQVWNGFFRKLVRDRAGKIQIAPDAKSWVLETTGETQLNGRDIRNALQTAITLAEFESDEDPDYDTSLVTIVTKTHFQRVLEMCNRFRNYVTSIRREDEKKRAQGRGDRNDYGGELANEMAIL